MTGWLALNAHSEVVQLVSGVIFALTALPFFALGLREALRIR